MAKAKRSGSVEVEEAGERDRATEGGLPDPAAVRAERIALLEQAADALCEARAFEEARVTRETLIEQAALGLLFESALRARELGSPSDGSLEYAAADLLGLCEALGDLAPTTAMRDAMRSQAWHEYERVVGPLRMRRRAA